MHHCVCLVVLASGSAANPVDSTDLYLAHTDDFDNTELLQTRFTRPSSLDREDSGIQHGWMDEAEKTFLSMSSALDNIQKRTSSDPDPATTLADFKTMMETTMQGFLEDEHEEDQQEFNERKTQLDDCGSARRWESGGDVAIAKADLDKWQVKHQACRASERAWLNYQAEVANCPSEVTSKHEVLPAHVALVNLVETVRQKAEAYDNSEPMGKRECDLDQTSFEDHFCTWRSSNYYACAAAQNCAAQTGLSALRTRLLERAHNRRNLWMTMAKLICRVDHLSSVVEDGSTGDDSTGDDSTDLSDFNTTETKDSCAEENITVDSSKFDLALEIPSSPECAGQVVDTSSDLVPSTEDGSKCTQFRQEHYAWDQGLHFVPSVCLASCPQLSYTPWVPPAECDDEPSECVFYNHHRDACGSYDTGDFIAGDSCCACGRAPDPAVGEYKIYRVEVSQGSQEVMWCIKELSLNDAEGTDLTFDEDRASASSEFSEGTPAKGAFKSAGAFCTDHERHTGWLQYEFENPTAVASYDIEVLPTTHTITHPTKWQMKASNDGGTTWIVLDDHSHVAVSWVDELKKSFDIA